MLLGSDGGGVLGRASTEVADVVRRRDLLVDLSGALARARTADEVAALVVTRGRIASGAAAATLYRVEPDGTHVQLVAQEGYDGSSDRFGRVPLDEKLPSGAALLSGEPVYVESRAHYAARFPESEAATRDAPLMAVAFACLPLVVDGSSIGVLSLIFSTSRRFDAEERKLLSVVVSAAALAIERVFESKRAAQMAERQDWLLSITSRLADAATDEDVAEIVVESAVDAIQAENAAVWFLGEDRQARLVRHVSYTPELLAFSSEVSLDSPLPLATALRTGQPLWFEQRQHYFDDFPEASRQTTGLATAPIQSFCVLPLVLGARVLGAISLAFQAPHVFDAAERRFLSTLTQQCAQGVERARLRVREARAQERDAAVTAALLERERLAREEAEQASRLKDEFLATVSHELRTPLTAILGWAQLLRLGSRDEATLMRALDVIERNARAQEQIISDLLDMGRVISGRLRLAVADVDLAHVTKLAVDAVGPMAQKKGVQVTTHIASELGRVQGDAGRLQQVVGNLLTNALKFTPAGGAVDVSLVEAKTSLMLTVEDTGAGIAPAFLPYVFEPFRQADATFSRRHGGLGLGLAISRTLVEMHGGTIEAASDGEGRGATIRVKIPIGGMRPEATPRVPALEAPGPSSAAPTGATSLARRSVLVVEDEPDSRELLMSVLEERGATVFGAANAEEALDRVRHVRPELVVSDLGLPGEDGLSLIRKIRALPIGARIGAVALTAFVRAEDKAHALAAGFDAHLPKPIDPELLVSTLATLVPIE